MSMRPNHVSNLRTSYRSTMLEEPWKMRLGLDMTSILVV